MPSALVEAIARVLRDPVLFAEHAGDLPLRSYQQQVAAAVACSVIKKLGLSFVIIFPRQSGKNELQAHIECYLLTLLQNRPAEIVKVSPTWKPQSLNAMRRLERVLNRNILTRTSGWAREAGYIYRVGEARCYFLSAGPGANIVGATANLLLECDEAQDVLIEKWDRAVAPMAAGSNATRIFWGTAWTSDTLLARELRLAQLAQEQDGMQRVFVLDADQVAEEVPAYGKFVAGEIAKHGRGNPYVRTQYFSEEIEAAGGMFPPARLALLGGLHPAHPAPQPGCLYAFLIDVGGQDETAAPLYTARPAAVGWPAARISVRSAGPIYDPSDDPLNEASPDHDRTALTVIEVDLSSLSDPLVHAPRYRCVHRAQWRGLGHADLYAGLCGLIEAWRPARAVIDATGLGEGLAGFLGRAYPWLVRPFKFSQAAKSDLGWRLISLIESGRLHDHAAGSSLHGDQPSPPAPLPIPGEGGRLPPVPLPASRNQQAIDGSPLPILGEGRGGEGLQALFFRQAAACELRILPGPGRIMRWGVPDGRRDPLTGDPLHDDLLMSFALVGLLDDETWGAAESAVIPAIDPLSEVEY